MSFRSARNSVKFSVRFLLYPLPFLRKIVFAFAKTRQGKAKSPLHFSVFQQLSECDEP
jgi:hypothetical protein